MANKYSRYELKPYVSQYVDPKWGESTQILRDRWDKNKEKHSQLQQLAAATKVGQGDQHHKDAAIADIQSQFDQTINTGSFENADLIVQDAAFNFMNNDALKASAQSYEWHQKEREMVLKAQAEGKNVLFSKTTLKNEDGSIQRDENDNPIWVDKFSQHSSYYQDPETGQTHVNVYQPEFQEQLPWDEKMAEIVEGIKHQPHLLEKYDVSPADVQGYLRYGNVTSPEQLEKITRLLHDTYLSTDHGVQQFRYLTQEAIHGETGEHYTPQQAQEEILQQMTGIAMKQSTAEFKYLNDKMWDNMWKNTNNNAQQVDIKGSTTSRGYKYNRNPKTLLDFWGDDDWKDSIVVTDTASDTDWAPDKFDILNANTPEQKFVTRRTVGRFDENGNYLFEGTTVHDLMNDPNMEATLEKYTNEFNARLKKAGGNEQDLLDDKFMRSHADLYIAHLITHNKDAYLAHKAIEGNSDKTFLKALSQGMESIQTEQKYMETVSQGFSDYMSKRIGAQELNGQRWFYNDSTMTKSHQVIEQMANDYKRGNMLSNKGSGKNFADTKSLIKDALADPSRIHISGFAKSGHFAGSYIVTLQIPANHKGMNNNAFSVQYEIQAPKEISDTFQKSHSIIESLSTGKFTGEKNVYWGHDKRGPMFANVSWKYNEHTKKMEPHAEISVYSMDSIDPNTGMLKDDASPIEGDNGQPLVSTMQGYQWLQQLQAIEGNNAMELPHYNSMFQGKLTQGTLKN